LREAIINANSEDATDYSGGDCTTGSIGADTINLADSTYSLTDAYAADPDGYGPTGLPAITSDITIAGNGATITRGGGTFRLFYVTNTGGLTLQNLTLSDGLAQGGDGGDGANCGGGAAAGIGGAILNRGALDINAVTFTGNSAQGGDGGYDPGGEYGGGGGLGGDGGGTYPTGHGGAGGGVNGGDGGAFDTCGAGGFGGGDGGQWNGGGDMGGAVFNDQGTVNVTNSTFSGNTAQGGSAGYQTTGADGDDGSGYGGVFFNYNGAVTVNNVTFANNTVATGSGTNPGNMAGGGVYNYGSSASLTLKNTILANTPSSKTDCQNNGGAVTAPAGNKNLIESHSGCGTPALPNRRRLRHRRL